MSTIAKEMEALGAQCAKELGACLSLDDVRAFEEKWNPVLTPPQWNTVAPAIAQVRRAIKGRR